MNLIKGEKMKNYSDISSAVNKIFDCAPYVMNLWNIHQENIFCNNAALDMFKIADKTEYLENFFKLSPERQPDGSLSKEKASYYIKTAHETGSVEFYWMHITADGEELPTKITLEQIDILDDDGNKLIAGFTRDLRPQIAGNNQSDLAEGYFFNQISHKELFKIVAELSSEWFFVYEVKSSTMQFYGGGVDILKLSKNKEVFPNDIIRRKVIYTDDIGIMFDMVEAFKEGVERVFEYRLNMPDGTFRYYRTIYKILRDANGDPMFAVGKDYDIHERKVFENRSKIDLLTNCYNKITTENLIAETINEESDATHALFIIDIDNFKSINDNLGHKFGDLVLSEIADKLKHNFRGKDIIGRIGGDEFIVFLKGTKNEDIVEKKAKLISEAFSNTYSGEDNNYKISGSIGISLFPKDGNSYEELYQNADKALYHSKRDGKDKYTFYDENLSQSGSQKLTMLENANRIESSYFDSDLVSTVFDMLYQTQDVKKAIDTTLQYIGRRLSTDRCYIFETVDLATTYDMTYEWDRVGISSEIDNFQNIVRTKYGTFFDDLEKTGVVYSNDLLSFEGNDGYGLFQGQDIKSFLVVQAALEGTTSIILGVDDCTKTRIWTEKEINSLRFALKMISIYLQTREVKIKKAKMNENHKGILTKEEIAIVKKMYERGILLEYKE